MEVKSRKSILTSSFKDRVLFLRYSFNIPHEYVKTSFVKKVSFVFNDFVASGRNIDLLTKIPDIAISDINCCLNL